MDQIFFKVQKHMGVFETVGDTQIYLKHSEGMKHKHGSDNKVKTTRSLNTEEIISQSRTGALIGNGVQVRRGQEIKT